MANKVPLELLRLQYNSLCFNIKEKEEQLQSIPIDKFVLNPDIMKLTQELKDLNDQRKALCSEIEKEEKE